MPVDTLPTAQVDYYLEGLQVSLSRLDILVIVSACDLSLTHPDIPNSTAIALRRLCRWMALLCDRYVPPDIQHVWVERFNYRGRGNGDEN